MYIPQLKNEKKTVKESTLQTSCDLQVVVFDLDDTLYDEADYCRSGLAASADFLAETIDEIPSEDFFNAFWEQFCTGNQSKIFNSALEKLGFAYNDELIEELIKTYREHKPKITLPEDSLEVLKRLRKKYTLALLTDGFLPAQRRKVQALKIEKFFKCIVYTEELGRDSWKPSPDGFEKILQTLKIKPENAVYIGDNEKKDFIAPNILGFITVQLIRDAHIHTSGCQKNGFAAQYVVKKISQLPDLLEKL
ncbi:MAG: HAD family hydrolase [Sedimentisphaerales bacterium]|nr:HAD family hydrolase [Sedimentisphaerales bacterium]